MTLLDALRRDLAGRQKSVAGALWPTLSQHSAESRLSRVLSGELAIPPELLEAAVSGGSGAVLEHLHALAAGDPAEQRREALAILHRLESQLSLAFERLDRADEAEHEERERIGPRRAGPVKVEPRARRERGCA